MSRWIEEKWLNKRIKDSYRERIGLDSAPSIDIVRCSECKYYENEWCYWRDEAITADDFCSYGEREGE